MIDEKMPQKSIEDYKFFCFNGEPKVMFIATDRATDCRFDFFDMDFNHLDIENLHPHADKLIPKPEMFEEMKQIAAKLSRGMKFVRIDLYSIVILAPAWKSSKFNNAIIAPSIVQSN